MRLPSPVGPVALIGAVFLPAALLAQPAAFTNYGAGCGAPRNPCIEKNWGQPYSGNIGAPGLFGLPFDTGASFRLVTGVEFFCETFSGSPALMNVWLYSADATGRPNQILAASTMPITGTAKANRADFTTPQILQANTTYCIVFENSGDLNLPIMSTGTPNANFHSGPNWLGPFNTVNWNYRVICVGSGPVPKLSNTALPKINSSLSVDLTNAPASSPALLAIGTANASVNLAIVNAPSCTLLTNMAIVLGSTTDAAGTAAFKFGVPNNSALTGIKFYTQWAAHSPGANGLDLVFSDGGAGTIGT